MSLRKNPIYAADLRKGIEANDLTSLTGKSILLTGATGLIGSALTDMLLQFNESRQAGIHIFAAGRSLNRIRSRFADDPSVTAVSYDALQPPHFEFMVDYIIHMAGNASPDMYVSDPVGTLMGNCLGIHELLKYHVACGAKKTVYVSSSEVYGTGETGKAFTEGQYGYVDILNPRSSYSMGKRAAETLSICYAAQHGCKVSIARPGHIYGPTASAKDGRVSSVFARQAAMGIPIELKSAGTQLRSYCYCVDCASAILRILLCGESCEAYNISNRDSIITIREMAEILAQYGGVPLICSAPTELERAAFNPMNNCSLNSEKLEAMGWQAVFSAEEGLRHTVEILKSCIENDGENSASIC